MAIDIRATVTCSLGTLISGSISDDYLQGSGLVKTRGTCEISGLITPAVGTAVTFSYTKGGVTRSLPRALRVLSSFADPFRRTTKVELGCKLTYLSDLQEPVVWTAFDDDENNDYDPADQLIVTLPIHANSVMAKCLTELGITASTTPLTNKFSVAEFDFGAGYVQVLSDLLVSESYFGYLDTSEVLQIVSLDQDGGSGPVYTAADIVDLGPIGTGQLPGEAVTVSYSTLKLKQPDNSTTRSEPWVYTVTRGSKQNIEVAGRVYSYIPETITETKYESGGERRILKQTVTKSSIAAEAGGSYIETVFNELGTRPIPPGAPVVEVTETIYEYGTGSITVELPNGSWYYTSGDISRTTTLNYNSQLRTLSAFNLPWTAGNVAYGISAGAELASKIVVTEEVVAGYTRTITDRYLKYGFTQEGQQLIATAGQFIDGSAELSLYVNELLSDGGLHLASTDVTINLGDSRLNNRLPPVADINNAANAKGGDPNNGWRTDSVADLELALGSATAQRRIEFSMPYAPDDFFSGPSGGPFTAIPSDAPAKANRYGRVQNRLLLGNRSGVNLQLAPERLPVAPFSPLYLQADGLTALYRANGNQWAFDSNGIVCSTDALFWAAVGGTGTFWFPVAPGITTLPPEPPIVDGAMNANTVVLPYNETAIYDARVRPGIVVTKFEYALELLTTVPAMRLRTRAEVRRIRKVNVPEALISVAALVPYVSSGSSVNPPLVSMALAAAAPAVASGASVIVPLGTIALSGLDPQQAGRLRTQVFAPSADVSLSGLTPALSSGASVTISATNFAVAPLVPTVGYIDTNFSSVSLLLHMDGSNGSTTITDSSLSAKTVTPVGNVQISTAQSKFGGASTVFDKTDDRLTLASSSDFAFGTGDFTIEFWAYSRDVSATGRGHMQISATTGGLSTSRANGICIIQGLSLSGSMQGGLGININSQELRSNAVVLTANTWQFITVTRQSNTARVFVNGTLHVSGTLSGNMTATNLVIGGYDSLVGLYDGYIDEFRITKGVARYTANFTPPTVPFPDK